MNSEQKEQQSRPSLCANNCGFYGNPANQNLCSKCYHEFMSKNELSNGSVSKPSTSSQAVTSTPHSTFPTPSNSSHPSISTSGGDCTTTPIPLSSSTSSAAILADENPSVSPSSSSSATGVRTGRPSALTGNEGASSSTDFVGVGDKSGENRLDESCDCSKSASLSSGGALGVGGEDKVGGEVLSRNGVNTVSEEDVPRVKQVNVSKCWKCNKKVGLLGFQCRCGYTFCSSHRYHDTHDCDFDYKTFERDQLRKQNKQVVADKLERI